jgi:hypothetical protein
MKAKIVVLRMSEIDYTIPSISFTLSIAFCDTDSYNMGFGIPYVGESTDFPAGVSSTVHAPTAKIRRAATNTRDPLTYT